MGPPVKKNEEGAMFAQKLKMDDKRTTNNRAQASPTVQANDYRRDTIGCQAL
jgi:hypothetical protein